MAIKATNVKTTRDLIPEGAYPARIFQIIHIGTVEGYQGKMQNKARITFELPTETKVFDLAKGEQPQAIAQEFTLSFNEKATLRSVINACDPKAIKTDDDGFVEFDIESLLGKACLITIKHMPKKDGTGNYAVISNYTVLPKGIECPPSVNEHKVLNYTAFDSEFFKILPKFLQEKIASSLEFKSMMGATDLVDQVLNGDIDPDDIPF